MQQTFNNIPLTIIRSARKTASIEVNSNGITVRAPKWTTKREIKGFLEAKSEWIEKHWEKIQERNRNIEHLELFTKEELQALAKKALVVIPEKVKHYAALIGVDYGRITIRNQKTRWGSCSGKGNLNFNCLLMLCPDEVIDSVVVHELCHRKHMNHSQEFYAEIEKVFPRYGICRKWLKENGYLYLRRLPRNQ